MRKARIGAKHPVRTRVANLPNYFDSAMDALTLIDGYLSEFGMALDDQFVLNMSGGTEEYVSQVIPIVMDRERGIVCSECDCRVELDTCISFAYYKQRSGRYEITTYVT